MAIGDRIKFFRNKRGMTMKYLGKLVGYPDKNADTRIAQYEMGDRKPKAPLIQQLSEVLDISPDALTTPDIDTYVGLMHTLFAIQDIYGIEIGEIEGELCLRLNKSSPQFLNMFSRLYPWKEIHLKYTNGEISQEEYDQWRYKYPESIERKIIE